MRLAGRRAPLFVSLVTALVVHTGGPAFSATDECDFSGWQSECSVSNSGEQVDIGASVGNPPPPPSEGDQSEPGDSTPVIPNPDPNPCDSVGTCGGYIVVMPPDVSAADLASFRPARPSLVGEPAGFGIVGAPTNVVAAASEQ